MAHEDSKDNAWKQRKAEDGEKGVHTEISITKHANIRTIDIKMHCNRVCFNQSDCFESVLLVHRGRSKKGVRKKR